MYENFNADSAVFEVNGLNVHPGSAKDIMVNAQLVAMGDQCDASKNGKRQETHRDMKALSFVFNGRGC